MTGVQCKLQACGAIKGEPQGGIYRDGIGDPKSHEHGIGHIRRFKIELDEGDVDKACHEGGQCGHAPHILSMLLLHPR